MSDIVIIANAVIALIGTMFTAYMSYLVVRLKIQQEKNSRALDNVTMAVKEVVQHTNGMKNELVAEVRKASFAQGVKSEKDKK